jgi:hypothetical protein
MRSLNTPKQGLLNKGTPKSENSFKKDHCKIEWKKTLVIASAYYFICIF